LDALLTDKDNVYLFVANALFAVIMVLAIPVNLHALRWNFFNLIKSVTGVDYSTNDIVHCTATFLWIFAAMGIGIAVTAIVKLINVVAGIFAI